MKHKKKMVAGAIAIMIGAMSCMTAMASSTCSCGYESDMYSVIDHYERDEGITRICEHDGLTGTDTFCAHVEVREYYCPEEGCEPWYEDVAVGWYWRCDGE